MIDQLIQYFNQGKLAEAIELGNQGAASQPRDLPLRLALVQLVCFTGNWKRVDTLLKQLGQLDADDEHLALTNFIRVMVDAESQRAAVWNDGLVPEFATTPDPATKKLLWAWSCRRSGDMAQFTESIQAALEATTSMTLVVDGQSHEGLRDLDDMTCTILEAHTMQGTHFWVPISTIRAIDVATPTRPVDHLWSRARIKLEDGSDLLAFLPSMYFHSFAKETPDELQMGRQTDWQTDTNGQEIGLGRRTFVAGDSEFTYFDFQNITLEVTEEQSDG